MTLHPCLCSLSDTTILDSVKADPDSPVIGDVRQLDITILHNSTNQQYWVRTKQNLEKCKETSFEVLEVLVRPNKPYVFDCLNLERYMNNMLALIC